MKIFYVDDAREAAHKAAVRAGANNGICTYVDESNPQKVIVSDYEKPLAVFIQDKGMEGQ